MLVPEGAGIDRPFNFWNMRSSKESRKKGTLGWWVMLQGSYVNTVKALRRHSFALPNCGNEQFCPCFSFSTFMGRTGVVYICSGFFVVETRDLLLCLLIPRDTYQAHPFHLPLTPLHLGGPVDYFCFPSDGRGVKRWKASVLLDISLREEILSKCGEKRENSGRLANYRTLF